MHNLSKAFLLSSLLSSLFTGCVDSEKEPAIDDFATVADSGGKSDSIAGQMTIVNTTTLPATESVSHTASPKYSAVAFKGLSKDNVDIWVRSSNADPVTWLLDSDFKVVAHNDDAEEQDDAEGLDSHITIKLPSKGQYYVVFRDYDHGAGVFNVNIQGKSADTTVPGTTVSPLHPESCAGPNMTFDEGLSYFGTASDTSPDILDYSLYFYKQECNDHTGCMDWEQLDDSVFDYQDNHISYGISDLESSAYLFLPSNSQTLYLRTYENTTLRYGVEAGSELVSPIDERLNWYWRYERNPQIVAMFGGAGHYFDGGRGTGHYLSGYLRNHCLRMSHDNTVRSGSNYINYRLVMFGEF